MMLDPCLELKDNTKYLLQNIPYFNNTLIVSSSDNITLVSKGTYDLQPEND